MLEQDVRYLKYKTYLSFYCPHCSNTFNVERAHEKSLIFNAKWKNEDLILKLSPFLDVFDIKTSVEMPQDEVLDDLLCPHCKKSIIDPHVHCGECGSKVGKAIVSAYAKLIPFYFCLKNPCYTCRILFVILFLIPAFFFIFIERVCSQINCNFNCKNSTY